MNDPDPRSTVTYSPSALSTWLACRHAAALDYVVRPAGLEVARPQADLLRRKGEEHEARYLAALQGSGRSIFKPPFDHDWGDSAAQTEDAVSQGQVDVIYQACLVDGRCRGFADFLELATDGTYEVVDTKLALHPKPSHILQLTFYSVVVGHLQGSVPEFMHLVLGNGHRESFRVSDYEAYFRRTRSRFEAFLDDTPVTEPYPVAHCEVCRWQERCQQEWEGSDHLSLVAGIRRVQVARLIDAGISTLSDLAHANPAKSFDRIAPATFETLREQAELQLHRKRTGSHVHRLREVEPRRGFNLMPAPSKGDVYYDIEGDPFFSAAGNLDYLHGVTSLGADNELLFDAFWGLSADDEGSAFERLVDFLVDRRAQYPEMHVYHYANYERAALQRLMQRHGSREDEIDELLRNDVLVDLYQVVRQALRLSLPSYSLKKVEEFYFPARVADVTSGGESTVIFERFVETGDEELLREIEAYNREDCESTFALHWWLVGLRGDLPWATLGPRRSMTPEAVEARTARQLLQAELLDGASEEDTRWLAAHLLDYHRRNAKPAWWEYFRHLRMEPAELITDPAAIGGIVPDLDVPPAAEKRSLIFELTFPPQDFKVGQDGIDPATESSPGTIVAIDDGGRIRLKRGASKQNDPFPEALIPPGPFRMWDQQAGVERVVRAYARGDLRAKVAQDILSRVAAPRIDEQTVTGAVTTLEGSYLFVQGPPGTGKTYLGAEAAVELLKRGQRVGVTSLSHKAIHNFLDDVITWAQRDGLQLDGWKKSAQWDQTRYEGGGGIENVSELARFVQAPPPLIAGTSYLFAREGVAVDTLFVDEAGQISLADALAMAGSARNVVLLGDPNQLAQVSPGAQPARVRASVLEHLLRGHGATVPQEFGMFLDITWRLRPELCGFISEVFYDGRLRSAEVCAQRSLDTGNGLRWAPIEHVGNRQASPEEAEWIGHEIDRLILSSRLTLQGETRELRYSDILVVAPYNAHVRCLRQRLPEEVRVGTVDKFQGLEAPVVFYSMASSSGEEAPRGIEFLFSRNRMNVAVSRAQCLAYVVASPMLLSAEARTPEQIRLINGICRFAEEAVAACR